MIGTPKDEEIARQRFLVLNVVRIAGVAMAFLGAAIIAGKLDLPIVAGYFLIAIGAFDAVLMPVVLARRWKSPGP